MLENFNSELLLVGRVASSLREALAKNLEMAALTNVKSNNRLEHLAPCSTFQSYLDQAANLKRLKFLEQH